MAYRKTRTIELRKDARRRALLEAATRLFSRCGYHAATVPMIVAEANCSVGCFYMYFHNKEDVFATILETLGEKIAVVIREARESRSDPLLQMQNAMETGILYLAKNPQEARILFVESSGLSPRLEQVRRAIFGQQADECRKTLLANSEVFSAVNPLIDARCLVGSVFEALCCWLEENPNDRVSVAEVTRAVVNFNSRALLR
jgi:TetR/AcrR family transcriptional regulator, fatty acid metabolism regulator protein